MHNNFYFYVKEQIKQDPCSYYIDIYNLNIKESDFLNFLNSHSAVLINFNKSNTISVVDSKLENYTTVKYNLKINNQIFLEYNVNTTINDIDDIGSDYKVMSIISYSSIINKDFLIKFMDSINEFLKSKNNK